MDKGQPRHRQCVWWNAPPSPPASGWQSGEEQMISERQVRAAKEVIEREIEAIFWSDEPTFEIPYETITRAALEAAEREAWRPIGIEPGYVVLGLGR
jgi:hypothetical protein